MLRARLGITTPWPQRYHHSHPLTTSSYLYHCSVRQQSSTSSASSTASSSRHTTPMSDAKARIPTPGVPRGAGRGAAGDGGGLLGPIRHKLPESFQYGWRFTLLRLLAACWMMAGPAYISYSVVYREEEEIEENARRYIMMKGDHGDTHLVDKYAATQIKRVKMRSDLFERGEL